MVYSGPRTLPGVGGPATRIGRGPGLVIWASWDPAWDLGQLGSSLVYSSTKAVSILWHFAVDTPWTFVPRAD